MEKSIFFEITDRCNHRCVHCCKFWREDANHTMSRETLDKVLALPKRYLTISGGEPSLEKERVFYCIERSKVPVRINTNLTNWTDEDLAYFNRAGVNLSVSVVSMLRDEYERITGADTFGRFMRNLDYIDLSSKIVVIVSRFNIKNLEETINRLAARGFWNYIISPAIPSDKEELCADEALKQIETIYKKKRNLHIETLTPMNSYVPANHTCDAGIDRLIVLSNGDIVPCACFKGEPLGNIELFEWNAVNRKAKEWYLSYPKAQRKNCKGFPARGNIFEKTLYQPHGFAAMCKNLGYALSFIGYRAGKRYLDLACGCGFLQYMLPGGAIYTGVDLVPRFPGAICADARDFVRSSNPGDYDYIVFTGGAMRFTEKELFAFCKEVLDLAPEKFIVMTNWLKDQAIVSAEDFPNDARYKKTAIHETKRDYYRGADVIAKGALYERV